MNKRGSIIVIEDDNGDQLLFTQAFAELNSGNEIIFFEDGILALEHLTASKVEPFIVFSDIDMPKLNCLELRQRIQLNEDLRLKCTPYLFLSSSVGQSNVVSAYSNLVQGFFVKPNTFTGLVLTLKTIIDYWQLGVSPDYIK
jgi:CheY-like chemotaxis protein